MKRTNYLNSLKSLQDRSKVIVDGWLQETRVLGNIAFLILRDREGSAQVTLFKKQFGPEKFKMLCNLPRESVLEVSGIVQKNENVSLGFEIIPENIEILNLAKSPLPLGIIDKVNTDLDTRLNTRFLDLRKPEVQAMFKIKSTLLESIRNTLLENEFIEVHTPKIVATATEGGTELFHVQYFENDAYLVQSPQLYKQIMMSAGFDRVFEIAPAFRAEEHNTVRHLNEFISIDVEMSFCDDEDAMKLLEIVIANAISHVKERRKKELEILGLNWTVPEIPFKRFDYEFLRALVNESGLKMDFGEDFSAEAQAIIGAKYPDFYFIKNWPIEARAFYVYPDPANPKFGKAFDLQYGERELTSGAQRNHDYESLKNALISKNLNPDNFEFYLKAFEYGMPPHAGWAIGLERLTMILSNAKNIREVSLFPRDRRRIVP
ncbi:MAG: aspartate--tRNA(Asn) ligase [Thermoplasmata archaeon]